MPFPDLNERDMIEVLERGLEIRLSLHACAGEAVKGKSKSKFGMES
mgnify:CR=1 FL=1